MRTLWCGLQMMWAYSSAGLISVLYAVSLTSGGTFRSFLLKNDSFFCAFEQIVAICGSQLRLDVNITPKYFTSLLSVISEFVNLYGKLRGFFLFVKLMATVFFAFSAIPHWEHRAWIFCSEWLFNVVLSLTYRRIHDAVIGENPYLNGWVDAKRNVINIDKK